MPIKSQTYIFKGEYVNNQKYGIQFNALIMELFLNESKDGMIKYLSSPLFPGVGEKTAEKLVDKFSEDTLKVIKFNPDLLNSVVSQKVKKSLIENLKDEEYFNEAIKLFLTKGLSLNNLMKIESVYEKNMIDKIKQNPYKLVEDINGIGFKTADNLAINLGFKKDDIFRIDGAIIYAVSMISMNSGNTFCSINQVVEFLNKKVLIKIDQENLFERIKALRYENRIAVEEDKIFNINQYISEVENAKIISDFLRKDKLIVDEKKVLKEIEKLEVDIKYNSDQKEAILSCLKNPFSIITGGPGTGKTTIIKILKTIYESVFPDDRVVLLAPTGRAAKRVGELTNFKAKTIHSFLKWDLHSNTFGINALNQAEGDVLIVDESSMIDNYLFYKLISSVQSFQKLILIGDEDQLPSIAPGNILGDLISLDFINSIKLNKIYRQKDDSNIIFFSNCIKKDIDYENYLKNDVLFIEKNEESLNSEIINIIKEYEKQGYTSEDIQLLAPMYAGKSGIDNLNFILQNHFNPSSKDKKEYKLKYELFREGDKVLQLKNQNEEEVYNGDIGILKKIDMVEKEVEFLVDFEGNLVLYKGSNLLNLTHAFCISIHKSQGSEYPLVILPISTRYQVMLEKKLLYTAVTRTRKKLILIGSKQMFKKGIEIKNKNERKSTLKEKIKNQI